MHRTRSTIERTFLDGSRRKVVSGGQNQKQKPENTLNSKSGGDEVEGWGTCLIQDNVGIYNFTLCGKEGRSEREKTPYLEACLDQESHRIRVAVAN